MECRDPRENRAGERVTVPLALLSAGDEDLRAAFDHVMEDLADALDVYERMAAARSGSHRGREETRRARSFSLFKIEVEADIGVGHAAREAMGALLPVRPAPLRLRHSRGSLRSTCRRRARRA